MYGYVSSLEGNPIFIPYSSPTFQDNCLITECSDRRCGRMAKVIDFGLAGFAKVGEGESLNEVAT